MSIVEWEEKARDELADIWVAATPAERAVIEPFVLKLERDLVADPDDVGESRGGRRRVLIGRLLVVWFDVWPGRARVFHLTRPKR